MICLEDRKAISDKANHFRLDSKLNKCQGSAELEYFLPCRDGWFVGQANYPFLEGRRVSNVSIYRARQSYAWRCGRARSFWSRPVYAGRFFVFDFLVLFDIISSLSISAQILLQIRYK